MAADRRHEISRHSLIGLKSGYRRAVSCYAYSLHESLAGVSQRAIGTEANAVDVWQLSLGCRELRLVVAVTAEADTLRRSRGRMC
jgi:hypothetical protein